MYALCKYILLKRFKRYILFKSNYKTFFVLIPLKNIKQDKKEKGGKY